MSIESTLSYIHNVKWQGSKPGLSRTRQLLSALGNPEEKLKFVHVAGTNGKGSTCAMISSVLRKAGYKVGLYISPYIIRFNERMQVNGEYISDEELETITDIVRPYADAMEDAPTEFELITAVAMLYFLRHSCDIVVLEVGMGGELDSTNVIPVPECAVITAIGLDHVAFLGDTIPKVSSAKAGIIKPGGDVVIYGQDKEAEAVFRLDCEKKGARLHMAPMDTLLVKDCSLEGCRFDLGERVNLTIPLAGTYQPKNAAVAVETALVLREKGWKIREEDIRTGLRDVYWPGRFEVLHRDPVFILDGSHNAHGITATVDGLRRYFPGEKLVFVLGVMADKDVEDMMAGIAPLAKCAVAVRPDNPRAMQALQLKKRVEEYGVPAFAADTVEEGVHLAIELGDGQHPLCAMGSLYFSGEVRAAVEKLLG